MRRQEFLAGISGTVKVTGLVQPQAREGRWQHAEKFQSTGLERGLSVRNISLRLSLFFGSKMPFINYVFLSSLSHVSTSLKLIMFLILLCVLQFSERV